MKIIVPLLEGAPASHLEVKGELNYNLLYFALQATPESFELETTLMSHDNICNVTCADNHMYECLVQTSLW